MPSPPKSLLERLRSFCAYQERSSLELRQKFRDENLDADRWDELLAQLEEEGYLNEPRFAHSYARGKFRMKRWGRNLIRQGLREKGIPASLVEEALQAEISEDDYLQALKDLMEKQSQHLDPDEVAKLKNALLRKGYEWDLIERAWRELKENQ